MRSRDLPAFLHKCFFINNDYSKGLFFSSLPTNNERRFKLYFFLYALIISVVFIFSGIGLVFLVVPRSLEKYSLYFAPFVGFAYLSYCGWYFYKYSPWGTNNFAGILLIPPCLFLAAAIVLKKERARILIDPFKKENLLLIVVCIVIFLAISYPYYSKIDGLSNAISLGNNDIILYATTAKYLMSSSSIFSPAPFIPELTPYFIWEVNYDYFSVFFSTAFISSLLNFDPYQVQNLVLYLFFIFMLPVMFLIGTEILDFSKKLALFVTVLIGINFNLLYILYQGFFGQIVGMGFFFCLFIVTWYPVMRYEKFSDFIPFVPLNVILCFGLITSYQGLFPIFFILSVLFIVSYFIYSGSKQFFVHSVSYLSLTVFFCFIISPVNFINRILSLFTYFHDVVGWDMPLLTPDWIFGSPTGVSFLLGLPLLSNFTSIIFRVFFSIPLIIFLIFSFYRLYTRDRKLACLFGTYILFLILFCTYYLLDEFLSATWTGGSYKSYKLVTCFLPLILIGGLYSLKDFHVGFSEKIPPKKILILFLLAILLLMNIFSAFMMIGISADKSIKFKPEIIDLQRINNFDNITSININIYTSPSPWDQMGIYHFLFMNKKLYLAYPSYYNATTLKGEWSLVRTKPYDIIAINNEYQDIIKINEEYHLSKNNIEFVWSKGWYEIESDKNNERWRWTGQNNDDPAITLYNKKNTTYVDLVLNYSPADVANTFFVLLDGERIGNCTDLHHCIISNLSLTQGKHELVFKSKLPAKVLGTRDPRPLGYSFSDIHLIIKKADEG